MEPESSLRLWVHTSLVREGLVPGIRGLMVLLVWVLPLAFSGCGARRGSGAEASQIIRVEGSDTMVNVAQAWAER